VSLGVAAQVVAAGEQHDERDAVGDAERSMRLVDDGERERYRKRGEEHDKKDT
jgi:hypothetical protein